jgi:hypothetical protein
MVSVSDRSEQPSADERKDEFSRGITRHHQHSSGDYRQRKHVRLALAVGRHDPSRVEAYLGDGPVRAERFCDILQRPVTPSGLLEK